MLTGARGAVESRIEAACPEVGPGQEQGDDAGDTQKDNASSEEKDKRSALVISLPGPTPRANFMISILQVRKLRTQERKVMVFIGVKWVITRKQVS